MKERIEIPVFTWFLIGALLFSVFTFLLGIWVCANAPRDDRGMEGPVPMITESETALAMEAESVESADSEMTIPDPMADMETREPEPAKTESVKPEPKTPARSETTAKPEEPKPVTVQATGNTVYYIQLTATPDGDAARKMKEQFEKKGYNVYLLDVMQQGKKLYKVRIGVFNTRKQAAAVAEKIRKEDKIKPWIVAM